MMIVFDLRSPVSASSGLDGTVRTMQFYIGDEPNATEFDVESCHAVRTMLESVDESTQMHSILLDSGADASVFPACMAELGVPSGEMQTCLKDAQGKKIPLHGMRDVELHLMDMQGRAIILRETVALSDQISQPILCFGHLLENGWSINGIEQTLTHGAGISIPIEMQNKSMSVRGWVRMMRDEPEVLEPFSIRAVREEVFNWLEEMRVGWNLSPEGVGSGKHYGSCYQDPTLACPTMAGRKFRTTLIKDGEQWFVMELCEPLEDVIDLAAEFHGYDGDRFIITVITTHEKAPHVMGFRLMDDDEMPQPAMELEREQHAAGDVAPLAPEDEVAGVDIGGEVQPDAGQAIEGQLVYAPDRGDHLNVNGTELFPHTALVTLREACAFFNLSQSGGKDRWFKRLWEHQKKLELQTALAARETEAEQKRQPNPQKLAEAPDERTQQLHMLTHLPFQDWCPHCVAHLRDGSVKDSGVPTISFDFAYTKAVAPGGNVQETER